MFVAIDGVAGAGKTTQADLILKKCNASGISCLVSSAYEKDKKSIFDKFIRDYTLTDNDTAITFLFQALYCIQQKEVADALHNTDLIIADRWNVSFLAYHSMFGELSELGDNFLQKLDNLTFKNTQPDKSILLDVSPETAYLRYIDREKQKSAIPIKDMGFFIKTVDFYRKYAQKHNWHIINGEDTPENVHTQMLRVMGIN